MPCPHPAVPSPLVALAGWCPLSPAGAQTPQLLVEPPWTPAVLWDRVTLTCQASGTARATTWYKDGRRWGQEGRDRFSVTESGTYQCQRPGSGLSPPVMVSNDPLVLQVPARALLEGDTVTLRCRGWQDNPVTRVRFYKDRKDLGGSLRGAKLSLSPLKLHNSGRYRCEGLVASGMTLLAAVTVTVHVAAGIGGSLLFLILLVGVAVHWHRWNNMAARKQQERVPPEPPALPEEGEVLYTHVMITKQTGASPHPTTLQDPQVTYVELPATRGRLRE
ncbi:low affinity immunoglobulin gamma Fc region receptor II-like [Acridotheres tristis]